MTPDGWWTWNADSAVELSHRASGCRIQPVLYAARADRAWIVAAGDDLRFGPRRIGGGEIRFTTRFDGTEIAWTYRLSPGGGATIAWRAGKREQWGLRYWIALCVTAPESATLRHDRATGALVGDGGFELRPREPSPLVTAHASVEDLRDDLDAHGYFHLGARAEAGRVLALRFNLEQAPEQRIEIALGGAAPPAEPTPPEPAEPAQQALEAVHDVMAWNHVHDAVNDRPYTVLSRFWNTRKFGGFGVWLSDVLWNAMLWSWFDPAAARANFDAVAAWQTEEGNFPCLVTGNDAWLDRSQIPTAAFVAWQVFARTGDRDFLARAYPAVARNHDWWRRRRSLGDEGFVTYGTSPEIGDGLYKGTRFGAQNESSMDNSPMHEEAEFDPATGLLQTFDVGLNSLYALDAEMLGRMAAALGDDAEAARRREEHAALAALISERLWDPDRAVFANRLPDGRFVRALTPTSFYPLAAGAATEAQARALHDGWIAAPGRFGGLLGLPSVSREHPAFHDNCYWRGRIWAPMNYWVWLGLRRMGLDAEASALATRGWATFAPGWARGVCGENYNADTGEVHDQPDADGFYSWGALFPTMAAEEVATLDPWAGLSLRPSRVARAFGPVLTPAGSLRIRREGDAWTLLLDDAPVLSGTVAGRIRDLEIAPDEIRLTLPPGPAGEWLAAPPAGPRLRLDARSKATPVRISRGSG